MTHVTHHQAVMARTAMMIVVVEEEATEDVTTIVDTDEMTVTVAMAEIATTDMPLAESIAMLVTTDTAAVAAMTDVEAVVDTPIVMREEVTVAPLARLRLQPPMVIQLLVVRLGNHMEVEASMMRDFPVENIDC
jgi:hypothetical protein